MNVQGIVRLAMVVIGFTSLSAAQPTFSKPPSREPILQELPKAEGATLSTPYELWIATFAPNEGSYGSGPRILLITDDGERAIANVRGRRTELLRTKSSGGRYCKEGSTWIELFEAKGVTIRTRFTTSPGEEACWVQGTITVAIASQKQTFRVKGVAGV